MTLPSRTKIYVIILLLMAATGLSIRLAKQLVIETEPPVRELPAKAGSWTGRPILFCQNDQCNRSWTPNAARYEAGQPLCPTCNGKLNTWSLGERLSLDANTVLSHQQYTNATHGMLTMSQVISPPNVNSIHRPQTCIFGQGYRIVGQEVVTIPLAHRPPLQLTLLELSHQARKPDGRATEIHSFLAYWFMDHRRQTPSHAALTFHLMWDRLAHGRISRWAYMTISPEWNASKAEFLEQVNDFMGSFSSEFR